MILFWLYLLINFNIYLLTTFRAGNRIIICKFSINIAVLPFSIFLSDYKSIKIKLFPSNLELMLVVIIHDYN